MYPHRIRLRGPWECTRLQEETIVPERPRRVTMPCRWPALGVGAAGGAVLLRRSFGYPGRIDADERVWLTFAGFTQTAVLTLNGSLLDERHERDCPCAFDVTTLLLPHNELLIELRDTTGQGGLWGEVAMEIRRTAYLRDVACAWDEAAECFRVTGQVQGQSERPLDLYVLAERHTVAYGTVQPQPDGASWQLELPGEETALLLNQGSVRVELVDGGVIWYSSDVPVSISEIR